MFNDNLVTFQFLFTVKICSTNEIQKYNQGEYI